MDCNSSQFEKTGVSFCKYILLYIIFSMIYIIWGLRDSFNMLNKEAVTLLGSVPDWYVHMQALYM